MLMKIKYIPVPIIIAITFLLGSIKDSAMHSSCEFVLSEESLRKKPLVALQYFGVKDTVFVFGNDYIEICIERQIAILHRRDSSYIEFNISSDNPNIYKEMETTEGIYTVQSKSPKAISRQFNNGEIFFWIGFNSNIEFHGLAENEYYHYLGNRPSSHGCVRIGRDDGERLYKQVRLGTPVIVYKKEPARILAFSNDNSYIDNDAILLSVNSRLGKEILNQRLINLNEGNAHSKNTNKLYLDGKTIIRNSAIAVGDAKNIASKQNLPLFSNDFPTINKDKLAIKTSIYDAFSENNGNDDEQIYKK